MIHCPSCGSGLRFDIASQKTCCDHCRSFFEPEALPDSVYDDAETEKVFDSFRVICPDCGAELVTTDPNDAVGFCPYCGGASVIYDKIRKEWAPNGIIPFSVTKEQCRELYSKEVKKQWFVSRKYRDPKLIESFRGIYMPYCSYQNRVQGLIQLRAHGREYDEGNYRYSTDHFIVTANADYTVKDSSMHEASVAFDDHLSDRIAPYDEKALRRFTPGYLCGFYAETGDLDGDDYAYASRETVRSCMYSALNNDKVFHGAMKEQNLTLDKASDDHIPFKPESAERRLYPVWFMSYRRGNKITYATVNGQTGKVAADLPLSPLRILLTALGLFAVLFGLMLLLINVLPTVPATTVNGVSAMLSLTGMYIIQHSFIRTVGKTLRAPEMDCKIPLAFIVSAILMTVGVVLATTDGTYEQDRYAMGMLAMMVGLIVNIVQHVKQKKYTNVIKHLTLTTPSMQQNGILAEAKSFRVINGIYRVLMYIAVFICILVISADTAAKSLYFALAAVNAAAMFGLALLHIFFQKKVAMRRPPQFNKKGAAYDEK